MSQDQLDQTADIIVQSTTGGTIGYEDGKIKMGAITRAADETLGEITGRNLQRQAMGEQRSAVAKAAAEAEIERKNALKTKQETDLQQSLASAATINRSTAAASTDSPFFLPSTNAAFASDFLGV